MTEAGDAPAAEEVPDLLELLVDEFRAGGLETTLVPASAEFPPQLVLPFESGVEGRQLRINTYFVPGVDDPPALQYFVTLPYEIDAAADGGPIARFLAALNANLPITGFEYAEGGGVVAFRHTHAVSVRPLDPGVMAWTWSMIRSAIDEFGGVVRDVCAGADVDEAITAMNARFAGFVDDAV